MSRRHKPVRRVQSTITRPTMMGSDRQPALDRVRNTVSRSRSFNSGDSMRGLIRPSRIRSFSTSTDTSNEAETTFVDHQNEIISQIGPQEPIEECPVEEKIDQCMSIVTQHIIKTVQGDMASDKALISNLLQSNHFLQMELSFYKSQFSAEELSTLSEKFRREVFGVQ